MSSAFYHEGLGYVTQHYYGATVSTHMCGWDPDCDPAECALEPTANCKPRAAKGYDGGKIPGIYFFSAKGQGGFPDFENFIPTYYTIFNQKSDGRAVVPANYKGPNTEEGWDFAGYMVHSIFKTESFGGRRLENCNDPGGRDLGN